MIELRRSPRVNVTWRGVIRMDGALKPLKVLNVSATGLFVQCDFPFTMNKEYQAMLEIPYVDQVDQNEKVPCKILVQHTMLSDGAYKAGVKFTEIACGHVNLIAAWVVLTGVDESTK